MCFAQIGRMTFSGVTPAKEPAGRVRLEGTLSEDWRVRYAGRFDPLKKNKRPGPMSLIPQTFFLESVARAA